MVFFDHHNFFIFYFFVFSPVSYLVLRNRGGYLVGLASVEYLSTWSVSSLEVSEEREKALTESSAPSRDRAYEV